MKHIVVLFGQSFHGKDYLIRNLRGSKKAIMYTTRSPRPGEINHIDYRFVSHDEFQKLKLNDVVQLNNCLYGSNISLESLSKEFGLGTSYLFLTKTPDVLKSGVIDQLYLQTIGTEYRLSFMFIFRPGYINTSSVRKGHELLSYDNLRRCYMELSRKQKNTFWIENNSKKFYLKAKHILDNIVN